MEREAFPTKFCRSISSYWSKNEYHNIDPSRRKKNRNLKVIKLQGGDFDVDSDGGGGRGSGSGGKKGWKALSPFVLFGRVRDGYMDSMIGFARKSSASKLTGSISTKDVYWEKRVPKTRQVKTAPPEFEKKLVLEIYKSIATSRGVTVE